jgi:hypothetical protein
MKADVTPVYPAFRSGWAAGAFFAFVLFLMLLPLLLAGHLPPNAIFSAVPAECGDYSFLHQQIYSESSDIDILFAGASTIWKGIDAPLVRDSLSSRLHRPAVVLTVGHAWPGDDATYFLLKPLLARRRVKLAFIQCPTNVVDISDWPHRMADYWFAMDQWSELEGLSAAKRLSMYSENVLGGPRKLLSLIRPNGSGQLTNNDSANLGASIEARGYNDDAKIHAAMPSTALKPPAIPVPQLFCSTNPQIFEFGGEPIGEYQLYFLKKTMQICRDNKIPVVLVHMPSPRDNPADKVHENVDWLSMFNGQQVDLLGVPMARLFAGHSKDDQKVFFYDYMHLNANGNRYFTETILPGILERYDSATIKGAWR